LSWVTYSVPPGKGKNKSSPVTSCKKLTPDTEPEKGFLFLDYLCDI